MRVISVDEERKKQSEMFDRILGVCDGHPYSRVIQVLVDSLICTSVATQSLSLDQMLDLIRVAYSDVLPVVAPAGDRLLN